MPNYQNSKIYKKNYCINEMIYIGSTTLPLHKFTYGCTCILCK